MCEHCTLLRSHKHRNGPILANQNNTVSTPQPCPVCIIYALLHRNTFLQRWNDITATAPPASPLQTHRSVHHPMPTPSVMSIHPRRPPAMNTPWPHCSHHHCDRGSVSCSQTDTHHCPRSYRTCYHAPKPRAPEKPTRMAETIK